MRKLTRTSYLNKKEYETLEENLKALDAESLAEEITFHDKNKLEDGEYLINVFNDEKLAKLLQLAQGYDLLKE
jgi:hypothetical protein